MTVLADISDIVSALAGRIDGLVRELLPAGVKEGGEWRIGSPAGEPGRSMAVRLNGAKAGVWSDFSSGEVGDALDLVAQCLFRGDKAKAVAWSRSWLGWDTLDPARLQKERRQAQAKAEERARQDEEEAEQKRRVASRIFLSSQVGLLDTPVDRYLRGRGIDLRLYQKIFGRLPKAIRFHPNLWNEESKRHWLGMVAAIAVPGCGTGAIHRTWLELRRDGTVEKAPLKDPKLTLGRYAGGYISLSRGRAGTPFGKAKPGEVCTTAEGIEDGFTGALACPEFRAIAAVSSSNLPNITYPPGVGILLMGQNEPPDSRAQLAIDKAIRRWMAEERSVRLPRPADQAVKDFNDVLRGRGGGDAGETEGVA